jgi:hypothetical protein
MSQHILSTLVSKLLVLDKIQRILDTAIVVNLNYPWEAQCGVARIGQPIKASTNDFSNERAGEELSRAGWLINLANKLESRYERTGKMADLEEAIERAQEAAATTPDDHPDRTGWLGNLGNMLESRLVRIGTLKDEISALLLFVIAWKTRYAIPLHRLRAAIAAIRIPKSRQEWSRACQFAVEATQLLPVVNNRSLSRQNQQYIVSRFSGLAVDACSLILLQLTDAKQDFARVQIVEKELQTLELGRGSISNLLIDDHSHTSELKAQYPEATRTFESLQIQLNSPTSEVDGLKLSVPQSMLTKQLDQYIDSVRCLPG